jgi:hypothetical protein
MSYGDEDGTGLEQQLSGLDLGSPSASEYSGSWAAAHSSRRYVPPHLRGKYRSSEADLEVSTFSTRGV